MGQLSTPTINHLRRHGFFREGSVPVFAKTFVHEGRLDPHDHEFIEIVLVCSGSAEQATLRETRPLSPGDCIVLRPGTWHGYINCSSLRIFNCCIGVELLRRELSWVIEDPVLGHLFWGGPLSSTNEGILIFAMQPSAAKRCHRALKNLARALDPQSGSRCLQMARLLEFLETMASGYREAQPNGAMPRTRQSHSAVQTAIRLLEEDLARDWTLDDLAQRVWLDPSYFVRVFKQYTGLPPIAYLNRCRAERAAGLLGSTQIPIKEIAVQVGWPDPHYFARRFKAHTNLTASDYRLRAQARRRATLG